MKRHYFEFINQNGNKIKGDLRIPLLQEKAPLLIFSHGFKGFRNWGFIPYVCNEFTRRGYISINFDFSLNGIIDDINQIYDDEIFRRNKVSVEVSDLSFMIKQIIDSQLNIQDMTDKWNGIIYLAGHSLGGAISVFTAGQFNQIKKMSLWASVSTLDRNTPRQKEIWKEKGCTDIVIQNTGQKLHLDYSYIEDKDISFQHNAIIIEMNKLAIAVQIIHPENDMTVKMKEAVELASTGNNIIKRELNVIEKAGHTFNCRHPFDKPSKALEKALESTFLFFES